MKNKNKYKQLTDIIFNKIHQMFEKFIIDTNTNLFDELSKSVNFENVAKGRKGAVIVDCKNDLVPIVRTTTNYNNPAQKFLPVHYEIIDAISKKINQNIMFNNALIEIYDSSYRTMGFHTDQSLDLADDSYICLYSCYENATNSADVRKLPCPLEGRLNRKLGFRVLLIKNKITEEQFEILLENNSIVLFSTSANHKHLHKIILDSESSTNKWLGITFRLSKTFVKFVDDIPYIYPNNKILRIANSKERNEFFKHKSNENLHSEYVYPEIDYTISKSDTLLVI